MITKLDTNGLLCPLPVLKARKTLSKLAQGDILFAQKIQLGQPLLDEGHHVSTEAIHSSANATCFSNIQSGKAPAKMMPPSETS